MFLRLSFVLWFMSIMFLLYISPFSFASDERAVEEIRIEGLERVSLEYVLSVIQIQVGEKPDSIKIRKDIERLFKLGFFEDISVSFEAGILVFRFKEKPIISDVKIEGRDQLDEEKLKGAIILKKGDFYDEQRVLNQIEKIKEEYMKEGFILADVIPEVQRIEAENRVNITLRIKEGEKFLVRKIIISGARKLREEEVRDELETKEQNILRNIGGESKLDLLKVQRDSTKLKFVYLDNGFLDVKTEEPVVLFNPVKREAVLIYNVGEGIRYKIRSLDIYGDILFPKDQILRNLRSKTEDFFSRRKVIEDIDWISSLYQDVGFAQTLVIPSISKLEGSPNQDFGYVSLDFKVERSRMFYVRRISITGNSRTRDFVIRREISLLEGEAFGRTSLFDSYIRLMRTGFFENVEINPYFLQDGGADINVNVKEGRVGAVSLGGGFSPQFGKIAQSLFLMFQGNIANFRGLGQNLGFYVLFGGGIAFFNFYLRDEHIFDTDYIAGINVFSYQSVFLPFVKRTLGAKPNFGLFVSRRTKVIMYPGFEIMNVYSRAGERIPLYQDDVGAGFGRSDSRFLRIEVINDSRDSVLAPTKGRYITFWSKIGGAFGGDLYFLKLGNITSFYIPTGFLGSVFAPSFRLGLGFGLTSSRFLPYPERFFAGGIYTMRGFDYFTLGPRESYTYDNQVRSIVLGGNKMFISNIELVFPISKQLGIFFVPFADIGQVFREQQMIDPSDFRLSTGFELRWISPFGPLRFSFGFPVVKKKGDQTRIFDFSLGLFTFYPEFEEY
ncbi:MAG: outer membrane protein assembly factor BamA [Candidatus Calescibacterium sp.]|nr:outer membrane protein assembly factor BamA [Candidatus Calescibacterium sp.]MDW8087138.1 outer membrane protein assembly factor BamA [Candidatus Calescibacterium sp.]